MASSSSRTDAENISKSHAVTKPNMDQKNRKVFANLINIDGRTDGVPKRVQSAVAAPKIFAQHQQIVENVQNERLVTAPQLYVQRSNMT